MILFSKLQSKRSVSGGFSLVEMITVIAIFFVITGVILANLPDFQNKASMDLVAQDVALTIRTAQVYSTATKKSRNEENTFPSYGIHFETSEENKSKIALYSGSIDDQTFDGVYDQVDPKFERGFSIEGKAYIAGFIADGSSSDGPVDIFFQRPNTEATLNIDGQSVGYITIVLSNKKDDIRHVTVHKNGQIQVSRPEIPE